MWRGLAPFPATARSGNMPKTSGRSKAYQRGASPGNSLYNLSAAHGNYPARRKLLPALYNLALDGLLPVSFAVLGVALNDLDDAAFRALAQEGVMRFSRRRLDFTRWSDFARALFYVPGSFEDASVFIALKDRLEKIEDEFGIPGNRVFYLAIPPQLIITCVEQLQAAGLVANPADGPRTSIIVEKPLGRDGTAMVPASRCRAGRQDRGAALPASFTWAGCGAVRGARPVWSRLHAW